MNSLASILYTSSSSMKTKKRKNLSLQPSIKPITTVYPKSKVSGMLFRSSTPKTSLPIAAAHPESSSYFSTNSPQSPRCSTPLYAKQRRTRAFIACELCRDRAFGLLNKNDEKKKGIHHHSTTLFHYQNQTNIKTHRRRTSIDQLLVWIV